MSLGCLMHARRVTDSILESVSDVRNRPRPLRRIRRLTRCSHQHPLSRTVPGAELDTPRGAAPTLAMLDAEPDVDLISCGETLFVATLSVFAPSGTPGARGTPHARKREGAPIFWSASSGSLFRRSPRARDQVMSEARPCKITMFREAGA